MELKNIFKFKTFSINFFTLFVKLKKNTLYLYSVILYFTILRHRKNARTSQYKTINYKIIIEY